MDTQGHVAPSGALGMVVHRGDGGVEMIRSDGALVVGEAWPSHELKLGEIIRHGMPRKGLTDEVNAWRASNLGNLWRGARRALMARKLGIGTAYGSLFLTVIRRDEVVDLGLVSMRVVTTAGVAYLAACLDNTNEPENLKYHGFGVGTTAEATGDTALVTELTTEYVTNSTRPTGSQAHSTNTYTTIATLTPDSGGTLAITEHGVFSASSSGTLWDRSKFSPVNLDSTAGDSLQATYVATFPAGS